MQMRRLSHCARRRGPEHFLGVTVLVAGLAVILVCLTGPTAADSIEYRNAAALLEPFADGCNEGRDGLFLCPHNGIIELLEAGEFVQLDHSLPAVGFERPLEIVSKDKNRAWTILFYDDADFDNAYDPLNDFSLDAYSSDNLDVVLLQDTNHGPAYVWHLPGGGQKTLLESWGEVDMGDYATLRDFIQYGKDNYPADRYLLCLYDHGGGHTGACVDQTCNPATALSMEDFQVAITEADGVDIIAFTAPCLMGSFECVYELRDCVDVYIGSEDLSGFALWHGIFHDICDSLTSSSRATNAEISQYMVQLVSENDYYPDPWWTMSAMSSEHVGLLAQNIEELAVFLNENLTRLHPDIRSAREACWVVASHYYDDFNRVDLTSVMREIAAHVTDPFVQQKVQDIQDACDQVIIAEWHESSQLDAHGLSLYFPRLESSYYDTYHSCQLDFADSLSWDEFLLAYYDTGTPVFLSRFEAAPQRGSLVIDWQVTGAPDFRFFSLLAQEQNLEHQLPFHQSAPGVFQARDETIWPTARQPVTYTLWYHESGGKQQLLSRRSYDPPCLPAATALHGASPNPCNPQTVIAFSLARPQAIHVGIYDLAARQVATLVEGVLGAGEQTIGWNGQDDHGLPVASGVYLVRLRAQDTIACKKIMLVK
jgi:hypothetical protein